MTDGLRIISRAEAKARGLKRYFTGKPCKRAHVCERNRVTAMCLECAKTHSSKWRNANPDHAKTSYSRWYLENKEQKKKSHRAWLIANREHVVDYTASYREANRDLLKDRSRQWTIDNPEKARVAKLRYRQRNSEHYKALLRASRSKNRNKHRLWKRANYFCRARFGINLAKVDQDTRKAIQEVIAAEIILTDFRRSTNDRRRKNYEGHGQAAHPHVAAVGQRTKRKGKRP